MRGVTENSSLNLVICSSGDGLKRNVTYEDQSASVESTAKGVNSVALVNNKDPSRLRVTLTWHAGKYKVNSARGLLCVTSFQRTLTPLFVQILTVGACASVWPVVTEFDNCVVTELLSFQCESH